MNSTTISLANQRLRKEFDEACDNDRDMISDTSFFEEFREPDSPRRLSFSEETRDGGLASQWISSFCIVSFDLQKGQYIESTYPKEFNLNEKDSKNIAFTSFPDVNLGNRNQDLIWSFQHNFTGDSNVKDSDLKEKDGGEDEVYYATCMFRQQKDDQLERGFLQKSVVLLSKEPLLSFQQLIIFIVGNQFFERGECVFEEAMRDVLEWPRLEFGKNFTLELLGEIIQIQIPHTFLSLGQQSNDSITSRDPQKALKIPKELVFSQQFQGFKGIWKEIWTVWELILLGEPVLIFSSSPVEVSETVLSLFGSIFPIVFAGKCRPFFTVHDSELDVHFPSNSSDVQGKKGQRSVILGVTNPHFDSIWKESKLILSPIRNNNNQKERKSSFKKELITNYRSLLKPDNKNIINNVLNAKETVMEKANECLSGHFRSLTDCLLAPLERYMSTLIPLPKQISMVQNLPCLGEFVEEDFLSSLSFKNTLFCAKSSDQIQFYRRFLRSENFKTWYKIRRSQARTKLMSSWLNAVENANLSWYLEGKSEVVIVDFFLKMKDNIQKAMSKVEKNVELDRRMEEVLSQIVSFLPEDVQRLNSELSSPSSNQLSTRIHHSNYSSPVSHSPNISPLTPSHHLPKLLVAG